MSYYTITFNNPRWFLGQKQNLNRISYFITIPYIRRISKSIIFKLTISKNIGTCPGVGVCFFVNIGISLYPIFNYWVLL